MSTTRTTGQRIARVIFFWGMIIGGWLVVPMAPVVAVMIGVAVAYEGVGEQAFISWVLGLVTLELVFGIDLGTLSIAYVGVALTMLAAQHVFVVGNWVHARGWHPADGVRALAVAVVLAALVMALSVVVEVLIYHHGMVALRLGQTFAAGNISWLIIVCAIAMILLRRIDVPSTRHPFLQ